METQGNAMTEHNQDELARMEKALETIDASKRESLRKLVGGAAFAVPVVASFAINGLTIGSAFAAHGNSTHS